MGRAFAVLLGSACVALSRPARAESPAKPAPAEHRVEFRANEVQLETDELSLDLQGDVVIRSERFRLSGDRLSLRRSPRGVHVEGKGVLALCPCKDPPIAFGLRSADLAPPSDVLLASATLRVFGVPVLWLPYLWLRSPNRAGMLPPFIAYRGEEGLLLGTGFHLPLASRPGAALDFSAGAYLQGGARLEARWVQPGARVLLGFDQFQQSALDLRATAASSGESGAFAALRTDWLAGERGQVATSSIERVALPSDRLRVGVGRAGSAVLGFTLQADAPRSSALGDFGLTGPGLAFGLGGALGRRAHYAVLATTRGAHSPEGELFTARLAAELGASAELGPFLQSMRVRQRATYASVFEQQSSEVESESRATFALPLARRYGELLHTLAPYVEATLGVGSRVTTGNQEPLGPAPPGARWILASGLGSALGVPRAEAARVELVAGAAGDAQTAEFVAAARARSDTGLLRLGAEARALPSSRAGDLLLQSELGRHDFVRLRAHVEGVRGDLRRAIGIFADDFTLPMGARLDRSGWSTGARLAVPWGAGIESEIGSEFDVTHAAWLAAWGQVRYRHPCRCMSLSLGAMRRQGRRGLDVGVNLELIPL